MAMVLPPIVAVGKIRADVFAQESDRVASMLEVQGKRADQAHLAGVGTLYWRSHSSGSSSATFLIRTFPCSCRRSGPNA
jgi:hypothetical protein